MNTNPKVLFIMHMPPPVHGAAMMGKYIHDSKIVNDAFECRYINPTTASDIEDVGKFRFKKVTEFYKLLKRIKDEIKVFCPDIVYFTANSCGAPFYKDFVIVEAIKSCKRYHSFKTVIHYHNKGVRTHQDKWLDNILYKRFFKGLKIILLAEALYPDIQKYVKREDVQICPNGIPETLKYEPVAKRNNSVPHILFLSNLLITKGVLELLDALKKLKDRGISFVCDFVGGESAEIDANRFQSEVLKRQLSELVIYNGRKYGDEKKDFFEKADVFVLPSYTEAFPLTILEAMENGIAVVASNVGGISAEVIDGKNGYLLGGDDAILDNSFKPDAKDIANKLEKILQDSEKIYLMGIEGRKLFKTQFTLSEFEKTITNCLKNLL